MKEKIKKYKKGNTKKDFFRFLEEKSGTKHDGLWVFGNLTQLTDKDLEWTEHFEMKYWVFKKNKNPEHELKVQRNATEYTFIIKGEVKGSVEDKEVYLKTGDYITIKPGVVNNLVEEVVKDTIGITIKSPSIKNDTVKIKKKYFKKGKR